MEADAEEIEILHARVQGDLIGRLTGNGKILSGSQAEPGQAIKSAVA